jgi:uncharacterized protein (UPF0335 family)
MSTTATGDSSTGAREARQNKVARTSSEIHDGSNSARERLASIVKRIEALEEEKATVNDDIKYLYAEGKSSGFDVKVLRMLIRMRRMDPAEVEETETLLDTYRLALGM